MKRLPGTVEYGKAWDVVKPLESLQFSLNWTEIQQIRESDKSPEHEWVSFKDPVWYLCHVGCVVAFWSLTQEAAGSDNFFLQKKILAEFIELIQGKLNCQFKSCFEGTIGTNLLQIATDIMNSVLAWIIDILFWLYLKKETVLCSTKISSPKATFQ